MPRQGNKFTAVIEVIADSALAYDLTCDVQTKNAEAADSAVSATPIGTVTITGPGATVAEATASGCLEVVRYKFTATGTGGVRWIHFRSNPPIWQPN
tara:strand:+ start:345 stop:635 length:291 start_codon:yes stop_codon:yes gene_type:complete